MPSSDRYWTESLLELLKVRLLERVQAENNSGWAPDAVQLTELSEDLLLLRTAGNALCADGLTNGAETGGGGTSLMITTAGETWLRRREERRSNPKLRAAACREALLDWCYFTGDSANIGNFTGDVRAFFEGDPFVATEVERASRDLKEKGYITGPGTLQSGVLRPRVTVSGKAVVEDFDSSIADYESRGRLQPGQTVIQFGGGNFGQISVGNHNQLTQSGASGSDLTSLVTAVLEAAKGTDEEERAGKLVAQLQLEAEEDNPEPSIVAGIRQRLEALAMKTASAVLSVELNKLVKYIDDHGIVQMLGS